MHIVIGIIGIIGMLLCLTVIVSLHELGHLLTAKKFGVYCNEYSIGMGPVLWQLEGTTDTELQKSGLHKLFKETTFSIRWLPVGGYVSMAGETDIDYDEEEANYLKEDWELSVPEDKRLVNKKAWQQTIIMIAGVTMNFILAFACIVGYALVTPQIITKEANTTVTEVTENTPAKEIGLQPNDVIIEVISSDGKVLNPTTTSEILEFIQYYTKDLTLKVNRDGKTVTLNNVNPKKTKEGYILGYVSNTAEASDSASTSERLKYGVDTATDSVSSIAKTFGMLAQGKGFDSIGSPISLIGVIGASLYYQPSLYLWMTGIVSLSVGAFNLVPLPALDGGRILLVWLDKLLKGKLNKKLVNGLINASFILLMAFGVFLMCRDVFNLLTL